MGSGLSDQLRSILQHMKYIVHSGIKRAGCGGKCVSRLAAAVRDRRSGAHQGLHEIGATTNFKRTPRQAWLSAFFKSERTCNMTVNIQWLPFGVSCHDCAQGGVGPDSLYSLITASTQVGGDSDTHQDSGRGEFAFAFPPTWAMKGIGRPSSHHHDNPGVDG